MAMAMMPTNVDDDANDDGDDDGGDDDGDDNGDGDGGDGDGGAHSKQLFWAYPATTITQEERIRTNHCIRCAGRKTLSLTRCRAVAHACHRFPLNTGSRHVVQPT